jgi:periplasmic protein TonB
VRTRLSTALFFGFVVSSIAFGQKKPGAGVRISCPILTPLPVKMVHPIYPVLARQAHIQGTVSLRCTIGIADSVEKIEVRKGPALLIPASTEAVSQWKYKLLFLNGKAVETETTVDIIFELPKELGKTDSK